MKETQYLEGQDYLIEKVKGLPFLQSLTSKHVKDVLKLSKLRKYDDGEIITQEGTYDSWIYIIVSGKVEVLKDGKVMAVLDKPGNAFGEMAIIDGQPRSATIKSKADSLCLAMDSAFLDNLDGEDKNACYFVFYQIFSEILAQKLRNTTDELLKAKKELDNLKSRLAIQGFSV